MAIVDANGKPFPPPPDGELQTSQLGHLARTFEQHPAAGLTPQRLVAILGDAEAGNLIAQHDLFRDIEDRNAHVVCEIGKRKGAVTGLSWSVEPPRMPSARESADAMWLTEKLEGLQFDLLLMDLMDAVGHGFAALEIEWGRVEREHVPTNIFHRPQSWFMTTQEQRNEIRLRDNTPAGAELQPWGWILHVHKSKSGYVTRGGLLRTLVWPFMFMSYAARDFAEMLEIYGLPLRLGKYPIGTPEDEQRQLLRTVANIGHSAAGVIPDTMALEITEAAKSQGDPFLAMISWCERSISRAVLGQTTSSDALATGMGSGVAQAHEQVRRDILESDLRQLQRTLRQKLLWPLLALNRPGATLDRCPNIVFDTGDAEDVKTFADALPKLARAGMRIPTSWAHEKLRIPVATEGEQVLGEAAPGAPSASPPAGVPAQLRREQTAARSPLPINDHTQQLANNAQPAWGSVLDAVREIVANASSLEALRDDLIAAFGSLPSERLVEIMEAGFAVAALAGRSDVDDGR